MPKYLDNTGLAHLIDKIKDGTLKAGAVDASGIDGIIPIENLPKGGIEQLVIVADATARLALTKDDVQNGDTVKQEDNDKMYYVVDDTKLGTEDAFHEYVVGTADKVGHTLSIKVASAAAKSFDGSANVSVEVASKAQGELAESSVQKIKITNGAEYTPSNGTVTLPAYPEVVTLATGIMLSDGYEAAENQVPTKNNSVEYAIAGLHGSVMALDDDKVEKVIGKGLSANDFTDELLSKLNGISDGAKPGTVTQVSVGAGLKLESGSFITNTGKILADLDSEPTSGHTTKLVSSGAIYTALNAIKTTAAGVGKLGMIKVGGVNHIVTPNPPKNVEGRTYVVELSAENVAVVNVPWVEDEAIALTDIDKMIAGTYTAA